PRLSVVIPAFNEAVRLPRTLARVNAHLAGQGHAYEIVVVDDGSTDGTAESARAEGGNALTLLRHHPNRGKGYAVRRGMLASRGARRLMTDADLSTPIEDLGRLEAAVAGGHAAVSGSPRCRSPGATTPRPGWGSCAAGRPSSTCCGSARTAGGAATCCSAPPPGRAAP